MIVTVSSARDWLRHTLTSPAVTNCVLRHFTVDVLRLLASETFTACAWCPINDDFRSTSKLRVGWRKHRIKSPDKQCLSGLLIHCFCPSNQAQLIDLPPIIWQRQLWRIAAAYVWNTASLTACDVIINKYRGCPRPGRRQIWRACITVCCRVYT